MHQSALFEKKNIYSSLSTELTVFKGKLEGLATGDIFDQRSVGNSDDTVALANVDSGPCRAPMISTSLNLPLPQAKLVLWM